MTISDFLTAREAARQLGVPRATLHAWNACGVGPLPNDEGSYGAADLAAWCEEMSAEAQQAP